MNFLEEMKNRGLIAQITHEEELQEHLRERKRTAYVGFDPTADSLHVGHLYSIMVMARWQRSGHRVIALLGAGTAMIGDPTDKTDMRRMMTEEEINANLRAFKKQVSSLLDLNNPENGLIANNADWLLPLQYLPFLREIGSQFSVNRMLTAECFKMRLEKGLSFLEFNYMLLQAYDFLHLFRTYDCTVQLGGDDQWSNMLAGVDLVRRMSSAKAFCVTTPLLTTASGKKMGKTEKGAVWIDPNKTSPYEYYQYWRNITDDLVLPCLKSYTFLSFEEIEDLAKLKDEKINEAKVRLAYETTKILHGEEEAKKAKDSASKLFVSGSDGGSAVSGSEPEFFVSASDIGDGVTIVDLLVKTKIFASKGEVRRMIEQGGLTINGKKVNTFNDKVTASDFSSPEGCLVRKGKKYYYRLKIAKE